jgi:hypothetical protein
LASSALSARGRASSFHLSDESSTVRIEGVMPGYLGFALTAVVMVACGGDDGTGPGPANVGGTWSVSVSDLIGSNESCNTTTPIQITLIQEQGTVTGSYSGGILTCTTPSQSFSTTLSSGSVANGELNGNNITFDLGSNYHHTGTVEGSSMSGVAQWTYTFGQPTRVVTMEGTWAATKQ